MKSFKRSPLVVSAVVLLIAVSMLALSWSAVASDTNNNSGVAGLQGPEFTIGIFLGSSLDAPAGGNAALNGSPYALSGFVQAIFNGSVHVWITSMSKIIADLGFSVGDTVEILCSQDQIKDLKTGDFGEFYGFIVNGRLVRSDDVVLPAPFSY
jgi:hypothetical protein